MRDTGDVAVVDAVEHLAEEAAGVRLRHRVRAAVDDLVEQLATARKLHEDEVVILVLATVAGAMAAHGDYVVVLERLQDVGLLLDRLDAHLAHVKDLDGKLLVRDLVGGGVGGAVAALAVLLAEVDGEALLEVLGLVGIGAKKGAHRALQFWEVGVKGSGSRLAGWRCGGRRRERAGSRAGVGRASSADRATLRRRHANRRHDVGVRLDLLLTVQKQGLQQREKSEPSLFRANVHGERSFSQCLSGLFRTTIDSVGGRVIIDSQRELICFLRTAFSNNIGIPYEFLL